MVGWTPRETLCAHLRARVASAFVTWPSLTWGAWLDNFTFKIYGGDCRVWVLLRGSDDLSGPRTSLRWRSLPQRLPSSDTASEMLASRR